MLDVTSIFNDDSKAKIDNAMKKVQAYTEDIDKIRNVSANYNFEDLVPKYTIDEERLKTVLYDTRNMVHDVFSDNFSTEEFFNEIITKPRRQLTDNPEIKYKAHKANDFNQLKKTQLEHVGNWPLTPHTTHHTYSSCVIENRFYVTGHSDCTFKIWCMNPNYFMTPDNCSTGGSVRTADFQKPGTKAKPLRLVYTSTEKDHTSYVTALASFVRDEISVILVTGDGEGRINAYNYEFEASTGKYDSLNMIFTQPKAHVGPVIRLQRFSKSDIVCSGGSDCTFAFWNIWNSELILRKKYHESPIQGFQFMNDCNMLITQSNTELFIWNIS
jgi:WD40 repeat protein